MPEKPIPFRLETHTDGRGSLVSIEGSRDVPFDIKRAFYVYGVPDGASRGGHAHHDCQQFLVCVSGGCRVIANGEEFNLLDPSRGLYVPPGIHLDLDQFTPGAALLVLCSHHYDEEDYVAAS